MRLFIAVNPPEPVRRAIAQSLAPVREAGLPIRWLDPEGIHLTLKFLGAVDRQREPDIVAGLDAVCDGVKGFTLPLGGFGAFPNPEQPRVVWVGCEAVPALELLQHGVETQMARLGFPVEGRPFRPHLTVGRARRGAGRVASLGEWLDNLRYEESVRVESLDLMESVLGRGHARYTRRHAATLRPA